MHLRTIKKHSVIATNACSGGYIVTPVIDINQKEKSGSLKSISAVLKAENGYFLLLTGNIAFYYTLKELAGMCTEKFQKVDLHMMATQDIGTIAGKQEFPRQNAIYIVNRMANVDGVRDPFTLDMWSKSIILFPKRMGDLTQRKIFD
jgi:hypothetical protein